MQLQTLSDPLGEATSVTVDLPRQEMDHFRPWEKLAALHEAGLETATAVFVDAPTDDLARWPAADAAFLHAIATSDTKATLTPLVWVRVRTAPRYPVVRTLEKKLLAHLTKPPAPRDLSWPADFSGVDAESLNSALRERPGSRIVQHIPPGDGWHRVAWIRHDFGEYAYLSLVCECSFQFIRTPGGGKLDLERDKNCAYRSVAAYLRAVSFQPRYPEATPEALRELVDAALAGQWMGQRHGDDLWGSNLYLQTASAILDVPMPWALAGTAVKAGLISLEGAVLGLPRPVRTAPQGPVMDWDSTDVTDGDWIVWWSRLDNRYQVEVVSDPDSSGLATLTIYDHAQDDTPIHTEQVGLAYGAVFGPDASDVAAWKTIALKVVS